MRLRVIKVNIYGDPSEQDINGRLQFCYNTQIMFLVAGLVMFKGNVQSKITTSVQIDHLKLYSRVFS